MARSDEKTSNKRPAEGDPDGAQPLTKRFGRLQIDNDVFSGARASRDGSPYRHSPSQHDVMLLDDTKHTTYIHSLDQELAEPDLPDEGLVILPLAARMMSVPKSILSNSSPKGKEMVLYTEPTSLTVPKDKDTVRKAILESRARARAEIKHLSSQSIDVDLPRPNQIVPDATTSYDDDPMDIDSDP
ncbi:hypothetical protein N7448_008293 [Penicillium atrosanguineum]|uniref:Uncharacterized protein n=1 Tax=Penicillium atrosanguineum TaxID=1132637 RepID=A0A9W9GRB5_9EURO|nr:malate dehydrogenase [Penicillium atrosanguineum]KAJ5127514.1 hypothetical protein N7448_008293 [Penicillium atrosanguineum]KAJ5147719.1 hypothetical protein N7526_001071 [Penicillium atrosanguineum]KAJ5313809.1 malate dehydrogenase [Penicillium atrosanguineum]KAJ5330980.1 hypothetical protein N7476_000763 [Penicillium atrosanguineum]